MVFVLPATAEAATWAGFDASRVNYPEGVLRDGMVYDDLRATIEVEGDVAPAVSTLSAQTLAGVDVFYTSLLREGDTLSPEEQSALFEWLFNGGTLIVTADTAPLSFCTSFTAAYGIDLYVDVGTNATALPIADHPVTAGVSTLQYVSNASFAFDDNALELARTPEDYVFAAVIEPEPGTCTTGRILVVGDHSMFTDAFIEQGDNLQFAANIVQWAGSPPDLTSCCGNEVLDPTEECDDGNRVAGDGCEPDCTASPGGSSGGATGRVPTSSSGDGAGSSSSHGTSAAGSDGSTSIASSPNSSATSVPGTKTVASTTAAVNGASSDGCHCRGGPTRAFPAVGWMLALVPWLTRRRRRHR